MYGVLKFTLCMCLNLSLRIMFAPDYPLEYDSYRNTLKRKGSAAIKGASKITPTLWGEE